MDEFVQDFLNQLELKEAELLSWGVVDGGFSDEELEDLAREFLSRKGSYEDEADLLRLLTHRGLLFDFNIAGRQVYRTRLAESIRLFSRLRQTFLGQEWRHAPTLVSDYRFSIKPRTYPRRNIKLETIIQRLRSSPLQLAPSYFDSISALLSQQNDSLQLSEFQYRATQQILLDIKSKFSRGVIIGAGTGTGKTLAFYLPALAEVIELIESNSFWTKVLAIYPRNELLKDQLSETYRAARQLDVVSQSVSGRKIRIGAFFGATPRQATEKEVGEWRRWKPVSSGYICPFFDCPNCGNELVWKKDDLKNKIEKLVCISQDCGVVIDEQELVLTRDRMASSPPDVVFTTTEMLNRSMGDDQYGCVFGLRTSKTPPIVLLDEVHTYSGIHGAQVALLIRRWRQAVGKKVQFTGLSATLRNATDFFVQLTGLNPIAVEEITPTEEDLIQEGMEYQLALRGDPVSATSLLSTSIQASMLLRRILDIEDRPISRGFYGSKVFAFTDDLDVTNRFYHNLLDAEGQDSWRRPRKAPLASLRGSNKQDPAARLMDGQSWLLCEKIGHPMGLDAPLRLGRTSSQDSGVESNLDIIVATASLEVGFNDPNVGGVIQHKAPRNMASFLQRKGRAGRHYQMRPWTVVVLSDYGRDRIAYQGYDQLFDPELSPISLPIKNRYVLRMQAALAFMDWIAGEINRRGVPSGSVWQDLAGKPYSSQASWGRAVLERQGTESLVIRRLLEGNDNDLFDNFQLYMTKALALSEDELQAIFWEPPRSLMLGVLPTMLRRLETGWRRIRIRNFESDVEYQNERNPLPDFIPSQLFGELNLPEVTILSPPQYRNGKEDETTMPIVQALKTLAPGRVTRRFAVHRAGVSHWVAPANLEEEIQKLPISEFCPEYDEIDQFEYYDQNNTVNRIRCIRPWVYKTVCIPQFVRPTSNGVLDWKTQILPSGAGETVELPRHSIWRSILQSVNFFTHAQNRYIQIRRFADRSHATLKFTGGEERPITIQFVNEDESDLLSIGFAQEVDGIVFRYCTPDFSQVCKEKRNLQSIRTAYFRHRILNDARLDHVANFFQRDWLFQIYTSAITTLALLNDISLQDANQNIIAHETDDPLSSVLDTIFQTLSATETDDDEILEEDDDTSKQQRVHEILATMCQQQEVIDCLGDLARVLWEDPDEGWYPWLTQRFKSTLGGALLETCFRLCPEFDAGDLYLDLDPGPRSEYTCEDGTEEIWVTESTIGGGGIIEEIQRVYMSDPRQFFRMVESVLGPSDFEIIDIEMTRLVDLSVTDNEIQDILQDVRQAEGYENARLANQTMRTVLSTKGILASHPVMSAINARVLRPGSSSNTDLLLHELVSLWRDQESKLGIEIDARIFAYIASHHDSFVGSFGSTNNQDPHWRFHTIYSLLWPRGNTIRSRALTAYNPFAFLPETDRELLLSYIQVGFQTVHIEDDAWKKDITRILGREGVVCLVAQHQNLECLKQSILELMAIPLEVGYLHVYPQVDGVFKTSSGYSVTLYLQEATQ